MNEYNFVGTARHLKADKMITSGQTYQGIQLFSYKRKTPPPKEVTPFANALKANTRFSTYMLSSEALGETDGISIPGREAFF